jgi:ABC-type multidrug transport system ATPase subunit
MSEASVVFEGVRKSFGRTQALRGFDLEVPKGSVVGLLGRNAAGKSTALRCVAGLERPDAGTILVLGRDPKTFDVPLRQRVVYLAETGVPFPGARVSHLISLCAPLYPRWDYALQDRMLAQFGVASDRKLKELSLGQQRAVGIMLAVCPQPELLVLDEPAANLDTVVRRELLETVLRLIGDGERTVIISSHMLGDVERVADRVAIMHAGQLLLQAPLDELKERSRRLRFSFADAPPETLALPGLVSLRRGSRELLATVVGYDEGATAEVAAAHGAHVEAAPVGLEELFIDLVGEHGLATRKAA